MLRGADFGALAEASSWLRVSCQIVCFLYQTRGILSKMKSEYKKTKFR